MNAKLKQAMDLFEPISLEEMDNVKLMSRVDTKYAFSVTQLETLFDEMRTDYRLLDIQGVRSHRYESLYFDTNDFQLYEKHQSGKLNRYKLRFRRYVDSGGLTFFEVKYKNNQERTIKNRVKMKEINSKIDGKADDFLKEVSPFSADMFFPKMWVNYSRMTFVNKFSQERLTIDTDITFIKKDKDNESIPIRFSNLVIAEAKRDKASSVSKFARLVRQRGIREGSISKYCFGIYNLFDEVKKNNFKPKVRLISKASGTPGSILKT